jgi:hypothetical protein
MDCLSDAPQNEISPPIVCGIDFRQVADHSMPKNFPLCERRDQSDSCFQIGGHSTNYWKTNRQSLRATVCCGDTPKLCWQFVERLA